jgi:hypothetical protein
MSREEDLIRSTTRAIASSVREVPPLRLEAGADELWSPARGPRRARGSGRHRRWRTWVAPVTAAAVVIALAVALVIIRDIPNGGAVPPVPPMSATGPDGIPRYYAAIKSRPGQVDQAHALLVGDSLTGETLSVGSPGHTWFQGIAAAADDRAFVVYAVAKSGGSAQTGSWYELHVISGPPEKIYLTPLPIKPETLGVNIHGPQSSVFAMALSGSAKELAVAEVSLAGEVTLKIFSLATGRLLHEWTANDPSIWVPYYGVTYTTLQPALSWIDEDRALALTTADKTASAGAGPETVRELNVAGPLSGNLLTDSKVVWTTPAADTNGAPACQGSLTDQLTVRISADGKTVSCATARRKGSTSSPRCTMTYSTYRLAAEMSDVGQGRTVSQVSVQENEPSGLICDDMVLWVSPSGGTLIGAWFIDPASGLGAASLPVHIGVISHGEFTPLPLPPGFSLADLLGAVW